ncbi:Hint domain-containing protein [Bordetella sp. 15P40C-2]|uniref:Hint domain-containing protein n=1 Tax=Bordetella sp. 15P40C-2 TaxID=2572246 RepID=UPI00132C0B63|nr:Hint domain-containing protein [Bordetella sp. 15P40C-2]MVW72830.1 hypothetical protein [Bordetella sp. 15P40C-2]
MEGANEINSGDGVFITGVPNISFGTVSTFTVDGIVTGQGFGEFLLWTSNAEYGYGSAIQTVPGPVPVCFVQGTLIDTTRGPVAIEHLQIGDTVIGSKGHRTVKWVGWRHYKAAPRTVAQRQACHPVRILAGALGDKLPTHDLRVSPWHHVYIDGVLVRAKDLINGKSVIQEADAREFSYYHVELDEFDVIRAHGVYSESWADGGNRDFFQNVDVTLLRPEDMTRRMAKRPGFKALRNAREIAAIHGKIAARTETRPASTIAIAA